MNFDELPDDSDDDIPDELLAELLLPHQVQRVTETDHFWDGGRAPFDHLWCSPQSGWAQIDTRQDAPYFGTWCHPRQYTLVNYCEGDITVTRCPDPDSFATHLRGWCADNDRHGGGPARIDPGIDPATRQQFTELGLADLLHPEPDPTTATAPAATAARGPLARPDRPADQTAPTPTANPPQHHNPAADEQPRPQRAR